MHELPLVMDVLALALKAAPDGARVTAVELSVGALRDAEGPWLERYFRMLARGTAAEGAALRVTRPEARLRCLSCGALFEAAARPRGPAALARALAAALARRAPEGPACPECGRRDCAVEGGLEFSLDRIEVEDRR